MWKFQGSFKHSHGTGFKTYASEVLVQFIRFIKTVLLYSETAIQCSLFEGFSLLTFALGGPKSVISAPNLLHLRISSVYCSHSLIPEETL
jgi:hypothetical protein